MSKMDNRKEKKKRVLPMSNANESQDPDSAEQITLRMKNIVEFAKFSFDLEEKREQSLINQSGQMLTAFSVTSAALLMAAPVFLEYTSISRLNILISAGIVLFFMLVSMVLAVIAQWRFEYTTMMNGEELLHKIEEDPDNHVFQAQYDYQWVNQLEEIQDSKKQNNDKRYKLIRASMVMFFVAVFSLIVCSVVVWFTK